MANELSGKKIAFLVANEGVEQVELTQPWQAVQEAGGDPVLAAPEAGEVQAFNHLDKADTFQASVPTAQLSGTARHDVIMTDPSDIFGHLYLRRPPRRRPGRSRVSPAGTGEPRCRHAGTTCGFPRDGSECVRRHGDNRHNRS
jgi:hypothetical protein